MFIDPEVDRRTAERFDDPQPGDRFHEMYSFWFRVVFRDADRVVIQSNGTRGWGRLYLRTVIELKEEFAYGSIPGYSVMYDDREEVVGVVPEEPGERDRWLAGLEQERTLRSARESLDSAKL